jgi:hypothetical protein
MGREKDNEVTGQHENAVLVFTKPDLAKAAALTSEADPYKPISGPLTLVQLPLTKIGEPLMLLGFLDLLKEQGITHVYFDHSASESGHSIAIGRIRNALAEKIVFISDSVE